jgi:hypothetical protein
MPSNTDLSKETERLIADLVAAGATPEQAKERAARLMSGEA